MLHKNQINSIANIIFCVCLCFFFFGNFHYESSEFSYIRGGSRERD